MIILTVGTQLPFDRLVRFVDEIAPKLPEPVFAQIGQSSYVPLNMEFAQFVDPLGFDSLARDCSRIVAHAGIGTVLLAQRYQRSLIVFPRKADLGEHRNDHQMATAKALSDQKGIYVAHDEARLFELLCATLEAPCMDEPRPGRAAFNDALVRLIEGQ